MVVLARKFKFLKYFLPNLFEFSRQNYHLFFPLQNKKNGNFGSKIQIGMVKLIFYKYWRENSNSWKKSGFFTLGHFISILCFRVSSAIILQFGYVWVVLRVRNTLLPCKHKRLKPLTNKRWHGSYQFEYKQLICIRSEKRFCVHELMPLAIISPQIWKQNCCQKWNLF